MSHLRAAYTLPFVGTVPAIKPACAQSKTKRVSVLGTKGTVQREYTRALIRDFAQGCEVTLVGSPELAALAEARAERRSSRRPDDRRRARALLCRRRAGSDRAHRHGRAGLHALSAAARPAEAARTLAGRLDRSGAGDRPPRLGPAGAARPRGRSGRRGDDLHVEQPHTLSQALIAVLRRPGAGLTIAQESSGRES